MKRFRGLVLRRALKAGRDITLPAPRTLADAKGAFGELALNSRLGTNR